MRDHLPRISNSGRTNCHNYDIKGDYEWAFTSGKDTNCGTGHTILRASNYTTGQERIQPTYTSHLYQWDLPPRQMRGDEEELINRLLKRVHIAQWNKLGHSGITVILLAVNLVDLNITGTAKIYLDCLGALNQVSKLPTDRIPAKFKH